MSGDKTEAAVVPGLRIRHMTEADLAQVMVIERENFSIPWREESFRDMLPRPETVFLVAEEDRDAGARAETGGDAAKLLTGKDSAAILGYAGAVMATDEGDVTNIAISGEHKKQGIATVLLQALVRETTAAGVRDLFLEVREHNAPALALYRAAGFVEVGRRRGYYDKPKEDALIMKRAAEL